jgi:Putative Actinobacterial Holin-X, holin superfamily III
LIQLEIALLKQETVELVKRNTLAVGMLAGAALCVLMTLVFVLVLAIQLVPDHALAAAVIVAVWLVAALALGLLGKARLRIALPTQVIDSMKENLEWAKQQLKLAPK